MTNPEIDDWLPVLTSQLRRTCLLVWAEGRPVAEVAAMQEINVRAAEKRLERARHQLRAAGMIPPDRRSRGHTKALQLGMSLNV